MMNKYEFFARIFQVFVIALSCFLIGSYILDNPSAGRLKVKNDASAVSSQKDVEIKISGCVNKPGTYTFDAGTTVYDALRTAGGVTRDADLRGYNLNLQLSESGEIFIDGYEGASAARTADSYDSVLYVNDKTEAGLSFDENNKCNINTADKAQLMSLPYIGEEIAGRIIQYREANGKFTDIGQIKNVKGVGNKTFEKIKDFIFVE